MIWDAVRRSAAWSGSARRRWRSFPRRAQTGAAFQAEELLRHLTDLERDRAVFLIDREGRIANWNKGAQRLQGYTCDEVIDRPLASFLSPEGSPADFVARLLSEAEADGRAETETWQIRKDGSRFWARWVLAAMRGRSGTLRGFSVITQDLTEQLRPRQTVEHGREALMQGQKLHAMGQLAGGIAHDFNNLLTVIIGSLDVLERRAGSLSVRETAQLLAAVRKAATQGAALTGRLLAFSRRRTSPAQYVEVNRLLSGMSDLLRSALGDNVTLELRLAAELWPTFIDPDQFQIALLNLAVNARDAMPRGGTLTIETRNVAGAPRVAGPASPAADYVSIAVSDTGIGMPRNVLERAFERFFTTKPESKGTGLGLSQVLDFTKLFKGEVQVSSEPGRGTRFELLLPRDAADRADPLQEEGPKKPAAAKEGETVLLVEDDPDVREFGALALRYLGYRVWEAGDAPSALRLLKQNPDVTALLIDVGLPGASGHELAIEAQRCAPQAKIVLTTGSAAYDGRGGGEESLLVKPFTVDGLSHKLDAVLHSAA